MDRDRRMLDLAARAAWRAAGNVEPNPMVGAVIARGDEILGIGHHRRYGDLHAEREALRDCAARGYDPTGASMYVTLEPCAHTGKQPPCTEAVIAAGIRHVVIARQDPHELSKGGAQILREAGIDVRFAESSARARRLSDPFIKRVTTGLPWVIAKWAQTMDGRIATRTGESQWISCEASRRQVHRLRARVDVVLTGIGTVKADDPRLTSRGAGRLRRVARRVVVDPGLETPVGSQLVQTVAQAPLTIVCADAALQSAAVKAQRHALEGLGAEIVAMPNQHRVRAAGAPFEGAAATSPEKWFDLEAMLRWLVREHDVTNVLVEGGAGLLGALAERDLVDECVVYIAPMLMGDEAALPAARGRIVERLVDARRFELARIGTSGGGSGDARMVWRRCRV